MVLVLEERATEQVDLQRFLFDLEAVETWLALQSGDDVGTWPPPSLRATTSESAAALERATQPDPTPRLAPARNDDGFGI
jgi:hypothetical protein